MRIGKKKALTIVVALLALTVALAGCSNEVAVNGSKVVRGAETVDFTSGDLYNGFVAPVKVDTDVSELLPNFPVDIVPYPGGLYNSHQSFVGSEGGRFDYGSCMFHSLELFRDDVENLNDFGLNISTDAENDEQLAEWYVGELESRGWTITAHEVKTVEAETVIKAEKDGNLLEALIYIGGNGPGYTRTEEIPDNWDFVVFAMVLDLA